MGNTSKVSALDAFLEFLCFSTEAVSSEALFILLDTTKEGDSGTSILDGLFHILVRGHPEPIAEVYIRALLASTVETNLHM